MLKFLMKKALFDPARDARHIEHWANPDTSTNNTVSRASVATKNNLANRITFISAPQLPERAEFP